MKYISIQTIVSTINHLIRNHSSDFENVDFVIGMSRGGLVPAALIATRIDKPLVAIYIDKKDNIYLDRDEWLKGKNILFVDDICRSGLTMKLACKVIESKEPNSIKTLTLFNVSSIKKKKSFPDFSRSIDEDVVLPWDHDRQ